MFACALALAGCGPAEVGPAPSAPSSEPQRGGHLRIGQEQSPDVLDTHRASNSNARYPLMLNHAGLLRQKPGVWTEMEGDLATEWSVSDDNLRWTFTIRSDAKWHDGKPVTAEDVAYSLNRVTKPPRGMRLNVGACLNEVGMTGATSSGSQVTVALNRPAIAFFQCVGFPYLRVGPKHIYEPIDTRPEGSRDLSPEELIGAGPFKLKEFQREVRYDTERFNDYYLPGRPYLDGATFFIIPDLNTRIASLQAGQLDILIRDDLAPSRAQQLTAASGGRVKVLKGDNARLMLMAWNTESGPFTDIRLRKAAHLAVDRQAMIEFIHENQGYVTSPLWQGWDYIYKAEDYLKMPGYRPDKTADIAEAKRLVAEATGGRGLDITLNVSTGGSSRTEDYAPLVKQHLEVVGIRATIEGGESALIQQRYHDGKFQMIAAHPGAVPFMDPDSMITRYFLPGSDRNWARWKNAEFVSLFEKESVERNQTERARLLRRMADILNAELPLVGLTDALRHIPMASHVQGLDPLPPSVNADMRLDYVWMDKTAP